MHVHEHTAPTREVFVYSLVPAKVKKLRHWAKLYLQWLLALIVPGSLILDFPEWTKLDPRMLRSQAIGRDGGEPVIGGESSASDGPLAQLQ